MELIPFPDFASIDLIQPSSRFLLGGRRICADLCCRVARAVLTVPSQEMQAVERLLRAPVRLDCVSRFRLLNQRLGLLPLHTTEEELVPQLVDLFPGIRDPGLKPRSVPGCGARFFKSR